MLDFDGTLAPIVTRADAARPLPGVRDALVRLAERGCRVAVISGRALTDVRERLSVPGIHYAGNHGLELEGPGVRRRHEQAEALQGRLAAVRDALERRMAPIPGAWVEDKGLTLSVHYRESPESERTRIEGAVRDVVTDDRMEVRPGKRVWEVRPRVDWDKGRAVDYLLETWDVADAWPLYIGDDETDEDAFRAVGRRGGLGVRVTEEPVPGTAAGARVSGPETVLEFLRQLAAAER